MQRPFTGNPSLPVTSVWVLHIYGKMGVLHIYGTFFYRKYATPKKFPQQNWQMWVIFCQSESHFFWDISKLPNLKDLGKTSTKKNSQRTQEQFFRNYATLFIGGRCIFTEITVPDLSIWVLDDTFCRVCSTLTTCCTMCGSRTSMSTLSTLPPPSSTSP